MPRIKLKPNSPEYTDPQKPCSAKRVCHFEGCNEEGTHKAPKARGSREFYYFCLKHVQEYNSSWNYFDGMSERQIREEMLKSLYGDRPTWQHKGAGNPTDNLRRKAGQAYHFTDSDDGEHDVEQEAHKKRANAFTYHHDSDEYQAMALMGLEPPLDLEGIKKRYKELVKKNHPDRNRGCDKAVESIKQINVAYKILKDAFEKYEKMLKR